MKAFASYLRHLIVTGILLFVERFQLPVAGAEDAANWIALSIVGTLTWLVAKYGPELAAKFGIGIGLFIGGLIVGIPSCTPSSYVVDVRPYTNEIEANPAEVPVKAEDVTPVGNSLDITGEIITDYGTISGNQDGIKVSVDPFAIDARSGK